MPQRFPLTLTIDGATYVPATSIHAASASSLYVDGALYLSPLPLAEYPKTSEIVLGPNGGRTPYIWTGTRLVLLATPCAVIPAGQPGSC